MGRRALFDAQADGICDVKLVSDPHTTQAAAPLPLEEEQCKGRGREGLGSGAKCAIGERQAGQ